MSGSLRARRPWPIRVISREKNRQVLILLVDCLVEETIEVNKIDHEKVDKAVSYWEINLDPRFANSLALV